MYLLHINLFRICLPHLTKLEEGKNFFSVCLGIFFFPFSITQNLVPVLSTVKVWGEVDEKLDSTAKKEI